MLQKITNDGILRYLTCSASHGQRSSTGTHGLGPYDNRVMGWEALAYYIVSTGMYNTNQVLLYKEHVIDDVRVCHSCCVKSTRMVLCDEYANQSCMKGVWVHEC